jgi:hypothetical protein
MIEHPVYAPFAHKEWIGMDIQEATTALQDAGFVNVEISEINSDKGSGTVAEISINEKTDFTKKDVWENDVPVQISYYALQEQDEIEHPVYVPFAYNEWIGMDIQEATTALQDAGFVNVETSESKSSSGSKSGTVAEISINKKTDFTDKDVWENDVPVYISYYAFQEYEVLLDMNVKGEEGKPEFSISTNLPDETELKLSLMDDNFYSEDQKVTVKDGVAISKPFTEEYGEPLKGNYILTVVMEPEDQRHDVKSILGSKGECLSGDLVETNSVSGNKYIFKEFDYESNYEYSISLSDIIYAIHLGLSQSYGDNFDLSKDGNVITAKVWNDGVAPGAMLAKSGDAELKKSWETMVEAIRSMSKTGQETINDAGYGDVVFVVEVVNDVNHDNILLVAMGGTVVYDYVNGIDYLGN